MIAVICLMHHHSCNEILEKYLSCMIRTDYFLNITMYGKDSL
uniref:Uncharacterized protein n=1 Tax=Octopus bimaculoides TaxID=37653 RepID=A0A0L8II29_OCTBM